MNIPILVRKRQHALWGAMAAAALAMLGCQERVVQSEGGSMDETSTLAFYKADGKPAVGARIKIFASSDTGSTPVDQVFAGSDGAASFGSYATGFYNIVVTDDRTGEAVFQDSAFSNGTKLSYHPDTLAPSGGVTGRILAQPQDDPKIAWIAVLGSGRQSNVDDSGRFTIRSLGKGRYSMLIRVENKGYTSTLLEFVVPKDSIVDLGDVRLVYTGLPAAAGVSGSWNRESGTISVRWDSVTNNRISGWRILRAESDNPLEAKQRAFVVAGHSWQDTVFQTLDTSRKHFRYWVQAIGKGGEEGPVWESWAVDAKGPAAVDVWNPVWVAQSEFPNCAMGNCRLGRMGGSLAAVSIGDLSLSVSSDGRSWKRVRSKDTTRIVWDGFEKGIFFGDNYVWASIEGRAADDSNEFAETTHSIADSVAIHFLGADGEDHVEKTPVDSGTVNQVQLLGQGDTLVLFQMVSGDAYPVYSLIGAARSQGFIVSSRSIRSAADRWTKDETIAPWIPQAKAGSWYDPNVFTDNRRVDLSTGTRYLKIRGNWSIERNYETLVKFHSTPDGNDSPVDLPGVPGELVEWNGYLYFVSDRRFYRSRLDHPEMWKTISIDGQVNDSPILKDGQIWILQGPQLVSTPAP